MADITPITRLEEFIVDAKEGQAPAQNAITRVEMFLAKIAGANVVTPSPITRIETFLASIAGETVTLPKPLTRVETFLAAIAGEDVETPTPITRVEIFLAEWAEGGGGSVIKTITGEAPITFTALAAALVSLTQDGKCTQDGTPTPDAPVDIVCNNGALKMVDDELPIGYKRIASIKFDGDIYYETGEALSGDDDVTMTLDGTSTTGQNIFGSYNGTASGAVNFSLFIYGGGSSTSSYFRYGTQLLRPRFGSGERTITFGKSGTDGFASDATATPDTFTTPANAYIGMLPNSTSPAYTGTIVGNITVGTRLKWIPCERVADGAVGYYEAVNNKFIAPTGTGTPTKGAYDYTHAHLEVVGTPEVLSVGGKNLNGGTIENKGYTSTGGESTSTTFAGTLWQIPCLAGQKFTVSWGGFPDGVSGVFINTWKTDGTWNARQAISASASLTYTIGAGIGLVNFTLYKTGGITIGDNAWIQVEYGETPTTYEPYRTPQTASVDDLYAVGDYADTQEIIGGTVTHRVKVLVLDGTENWYTSASFLSGMYNLTLPDLYAEKTTVTTNRKTPYCTHFERSTNWIAAGNRVNKIQAMSNAAETECVIGLGYGTATSAEVDNFKAWLAAQYDNGTPVIVLYPLAEETTESVTAQALRTSEGANTISVTSEVDPVTLTAEYKAEPEPEEVDEP